MTTKEKPLGGRTAVVTGASRGIGKAIALALADAGADVAILSRSAKEITLVQNAIEGCGVRCLAEECDVTDNQRLEKFIERCAERLSPPAILINNAGVYSTQPLIHRSPNLMEIWQQTLNTNLTAAMWATKCVLPDMIRVGWGRVVNISSISGKAGEQFGSAYSASKFGMIGLTQSVALEVAKMGITVNAVCPGWVDTEMAIKQLTDEKWCKLNDVPVNESIEIARMSVPHGRLIQPEEVASLVVFLCGNDAGSITGQAINICGGLSLH